MSIPPYPPGILAAKYNFLPSTDKLGCAKLALSVAKGRSIASPHVLPCFFAMNTPHLFSLFFSSGHLVKKIISPFLATQARPSLTGVETAGGRRTGVDHLPFLSI